MSSKKGKKLTDNLAERKKELLSAKEKMLEMKRTVLNLTELMVEKNINSNWFLEACTKLCQDSYQDITVERTIEHLCGYPLCDEEIKIASKQQFHISLSAKKIYDITDRKNFCSNKCYKASTYVKSQIPQLPLYMRKENESVTTISLLNPSKNKGSLGEEVIFDAHLKKEEIEDSVDVPTNHMSDLLRKEVEQCVQQLKNMKITENVFEHPYVFQPNELSDPKVEISSDEEQNEEERNFLDYEIPSGLDEKYMPIRNRKEGTKKAVLIEPPNLKVASDLSSPTISIEFLKKVFQDWFTLDTLKYLLGERTVYEMESDLIFKQTAGSESIKQKYIDLCLKVESYPEDVDGISDTCFDVSPLKEEQKFQHESVPSKKNPNRRPKKNDSVSFAPQKIVRKQKDVSDKPPNSVPTSEPIFPLIDSLSQNALRRQLLMDKLKTIYINALPLIGLYYQDIRENVKAMVGTFCLTPTNITYKPKEWKCIAFVLFRMLTVTKLKELHNEASLLALHNKCVSQSNLSVADVELLALDLVSAEHLQRMKGFHPT